MSVVIQRFRKTAQDGTTVTLQPSTTSYSEAKSTHLKATQIVLTFAATPADMFGTAITDDVDFEVTIKRAT
jgi:hypothetical protein